MSNANRIGLLVVALVVVLLLLFTLNKPSDVTTPEQAAVPVQDQTAAAPPPPPMPLPPSVVKTITAKELADELASAQPPFLLDVREPDEISVGMIKGAVSIPMTVLPTRLAEVPKDKPVVVYCRSGNRGQQAAELLMNSGVANVRNLTGGYTEWSVTTATPPAAPTPPAEGAVPAVGGTPAPTNP